MHMKICTKCDEEKPEQSFAWRNKEDGVRSASCKACHREYTKKHYRQNKDQYKAKAIKNNERYAKRNREFVFDYLKSHHCVDCGESDYRVLQFDHIEGEKEFEISLAVSNSYAVDTIKKEIEKCEVRCANCHFKKTAERGNWYAWLDL